MKPIIMLSVGVICALALPACSIQTTNDKINSAVSSGLPAVCSALSIAHAAFTTVAATGKLGLARTRLGVSAAATGGGTSAAFGPSNDRINMMLGVGMRFDLTKQFGVRAEYDYYNNVGDGTTTGQTGVAVWSLNGFYRF